METRIKNYGVLVSEDDTATSIINKTITNVSNSLTKNYIGPYAFYNCKKLKSAIISDCMTIGSSAFYGCTALETLVLPTTLSGGIGSYAFKDCTSLKEVVLSPWMSSSSYNWGTFEGCTGLTKVTIPYYWQMKLQYNMFKDCTSLNTIIFKGTVSQWNSISKDSTWNTNVPATYVQCTDGQAQL